MKFDVYTIDQLEAAIKPLSEGIADFEVKDADEKISKNGNAMIVLTLKIYDKNGNVGFISDYLLGNNPYAIQKLRAFCDATRLLEIYQSGKIDEQNCIGKTGKAKLAFEKNKDPNYPDRLRVKEYLPPDPLDDQHELPF